MKEINKIVVYGGGSWGTALANYACTISNQTGIYTIEEDVEQDINRNHLNSKYLGEIPIAEKLVASTDISIIDDADIIILVVPSFAFTDSLNVIKSRGISEDTILLIATKGIAANPAELFSSRLKKILPNRFGFLSGPNFAGEVAKGMSASITISSEDPTLTDYLLPLFTTDNMEVTITDDIITQQIAGIVKNIIAISCGMLTAGGGGENARATMLSKGLREIAVISTALGGKIETIVEPAVVGDLVLTSLSSTSRNTKFGSEFYKSGYSKEFLQNYPILVEGVQAARLIKKLVDIDKLNVPVIANVVKLVA